MHDEYLRRIRAGNDSDALARLIELDQAGVFRFMLRRLGHRQDAEDATQELFRRVITALPSLRDLKGYRGWLYRIAHRVVQAQHDSRRGERRRVEVLARTAPMAGSSSMPDSNDVERRAQIQTALESLDEDLRTVVQLRYEQGLSYEEIAEATQRPLGTVSKRLHNAHLKLQQALAAVGAAAAMAALGDALAAEAIPSELAVRLKRMALETTLRPASAPAGKLGAFATAGILAALLLGVPVVRRMSASSSGVLASADRGKSSRAADSPTLVAREAAARLAPAPGDREQPSPALLRGRVIDRETRAAIGGAAVCLISDAKGTDNVIRTTTTPDGSFSLHVRAGTYTLDAVAPGFTRYCMERMMEEQRTGVFAKDEAEAREASAAVWKCFRIELAAGSETERTLDLIASAEIRGVVVDRKGYPVPGAQVTSDYLSLVYTVPRGPNQSVEHHLDTIVDPDGTSLKTVSDLQGRFSFSNVYPNGFLPLAVTCAGYRTLEQSVPLEKGERPITLVLDPGAGYGGQVFAQGGQPVPGACVVLLAAPTLRQFGALMTGKGGEFQAVDQHAGATLAAVFAPGFAPRLLDLPGLDPLQIRVPLSRAESPVSGLVVDEAGNALEGASVSVQRYEMSAGGRLVLMGFLSKAGSNSLSGPLGTLAFFLPGVFAAPSDESKTDGAFRLEGVALTGDHRTFVQCSKEGYEREESEASASAPVRITLRKRTP
jgi:RNA polymerase sigma-70 factor (ECF subfamily)